MKKNKQLNLYFNDKPIKSKETDYQESRINIVISVFLIFFFIISARLFFLGFDKNVNIYSNNVINYFMKEEIL